MSNAVVATVAVGSRPTSLCYNHTYGKLYCADSTNGLISVISGQNRVEKNVSGGIRVTGLCIVARAASSIAGYLPKAPSLPLTALPTRSLPEFGWTACFHSYATCLSTIRLYCGSRHGDQGILAAIDCATDSVVATVSLQRPPRSLSYNSVDDRLYCGAETGPMWRSRKLLRATAHRALRHRLFRGRKPLHLRFRQAYLCFRYFLYIVDAAG